MDAGRYYVLSRLYQQRGMTELVLGTWVKMIDGTWVDEEFKHGEERMRDYLIKCRDVALMFRYAMWLVRRNPEAGVQVPPKQPFFAFLFVYNEGGSCERFEEEDEEFDERRDYRCVTRGESRRFETVS